MLKFALFLLVLSAISLILWLMEVSTLPADNTLRNAALALGGLGFVLLLVRLFIRGRIRS